MASLIQKVASSALKAFGVLGKGHKSVDLSDAMTEVASNMNNLTATDVNFQYERVTEDRMNFYKDRYSDSESDSPSSSPDRHVDYAPVTHISLADNSSYSMSIFVLHPGGFLPLHDHPSMYGFIKVIHGSIEIRSYTLSGHESTSEPIPAVLSSKTIVTPSDDCCTLSPTENNLHHISASAGESAAFIDVLSPPYDHENYTRPCNYYKLTNKQKVTNKHKASDNPNFVWLVRTEPGEFWCDNVAYNGPDIYEK